MFDDGDDFSGFGRAPRDDPLLGDLDGDVGGDDEGASDENIFKHQKDSILFLIDTHSSMFEQLQLLNSSSTPSDDKKDSIPFYFTLKAVANCYSDKIISSPSDVLGVVFYNTKLKQNQFDFNNIYVYQDLNTPDAKRIKDIESMIDQPFAIGSSDKVQSSQQNSQSGNSPTSALHEALWTCQHLFSLANNQTKLGYKRIFLFTNDDNPCKDNSTLRMKCIERSRDLMNSDISIDLFVLKSPPSSFKSDLFWKEMIHISDDDYTGNITYDCVEMFKDLRERIRRREFKKRGITSIPFIIGDESDPESMIQLNVTLYSLYSKSHKPSATNLHSDTNKPLRCETKYTCVDTGAELMKNHATTTMEEGTMIEGSAVSSSDMAYYYEYGGHKAEFSADELKQIRKLQSNINQTNTYTQPGIKLIGFKPKSRLKVYHNLKSSGFIYPNDQSIQGSSLTLSALHKKMIEMNKIAICRYIQREGTSPLFIALIAQGEVLDEQDQSQITPPGFQIIFLPFAEGIRKPQVFSNQETATDKFVQMAKKLTKKLNIDFDSSQFDNPSLQQFYQALQALALEHPQVEAIDDTLKPDVEGMKKYETLMNEFKDAIFPEEYDPEGAVKPKTSRKKAEVKEEEGEKTEKKKNEAKKRKKTDEEDSQEVVKKKPTKKVKKEKELSDDDEEEEIDMVQLIKDGEANKLKLDILKEFCRQYKLKVSGTKQDLIDRITEFLKKKKKI